MVDVGVDRFEDEGVLREKEGCFGVDTEKKQGVDGKDDLFLEVALESHDEMFDLGHDGVQFGPLEVGHGGVVVSLIIVLLEFS